VIAPSSNLGLARFGVFMRIAVTFFLLGLAVAEPARALTYVPMTDADLLANAEGVFVGQVTAIASAPVAISATPNETRYAIAIERVLVGPALSPIETLVLPGSAPGADYGLFVPGVPLLEPGQRVLVFYHRGQDGLLAPAQLVLGLFFRARLGNEAVYVRALAHSHALGKSGTDATDWLRRVEAFERWIEARAAGLAIEGEYTLRMPARYALGGPKFTLTRSPQGYPLRWFAFDTGNTLTWRAHVSGLAGTPTVDEFALLQQALAAWTGDAGSRINLAYGGTTPSDTGVNGLDGVNAVLWDDPLAQINGTQGYICGQGGVVGVGGALFSNSTTRFGSQHYHSIIEGWVVIETNAGCYFEDLAGANGATALVHELGHALGLGHACGDALSPPCGSDPALANASMRTPLLNDARGAVLGVDDRAAIAQVYPLVLPEIPLFADGFE
jgi:hypothetical protein